MNEEDVVKGIVEMLKGINNSAADLVQKGDLENAVKMYELAEQTSLKFYFYDGALVNRLYIAKIHIMEEEFNKAVDCLDILEKYTVSPNIENEIIRFYKEAGMILLKAGMKMEADGDLSSALRLFEKVQPYLNKKRAEIVEKEIMLLRSKVGTNVNST
jgi:hypothetical protein